MRIHIYPLLGRYVTEHLTNERRVMYISIIYKYLYECVFHGRGRQLGDAANPLFRRSVTEHLSNEPRVMHILYIYI